MQTGNIIVLGLYASGASSARISSLCASFFSFMLAGLISGRLAHFVGGHRRWWLVCNCFLQTALIFLAIALIYTGVILTTDDAAYVLVLLLAASFGCQVAMARLLSCPEILTVVVTGTFIDLLIDPKIFESDNLPRNRRAGFLICFIGGVFVGSFAYAKVNAQMPLIIGGLVNILVTLSFFFVKKARPPASSSP